MSEIPHRRPLPADREQLGALVAIAGLPNLTPRRFWSLVAADDPTDVWDRLGHGTHDGIAQDHRSRWLDWTATVQPLVELERHRRAGVDPIPFGTPDYPAAFLDDPEPPPVVFSAGPATVAERPAVAIVGTRRCTRYGRDIAHDLGLALARSGAVVVSGWARGVDAAAHAGAMTADPSAAVAIVAGGVDVIYPRSNAGLWAQLLGSGRILSEWPLGCRPRAWRFPARNRLIAGLSMAIVVVESGVRGGSLYTVDEALRRNRDVHAVPGSIHSPVSAGTNRLIADGAQVLYDVDAFVAAVVPAQAQLRGVGLIEPGAAASTAPTSWVLDAIGFEPMTLDSLVATSGRGAGEVLLEVERLIAAGVLERHGSVLVRR